MSGLDVKRNFFVGVMWLVFFLLMWVGLEKVIVMFVWRIKVELGGEGLNVCVCVCLDWFPSDFFDEKDMTTKKSSSSSFSFSLRFYLAKIGLDVDHTEQQDVEEVILAFRQLVLVHSVLQHVSQYRENQRCLCWIEWDEEQETFTTLRSKTYHTLHVSCSKLQTHS